MLKKANHSDFIDSLVITKRGNLKVVENVKHTIDDATKLGLSWYVRGASKITIKTAKTLRQAGVFKVAERDLYQNLETGDFWKISDDKKNLVRMFKEQDGVADKVSSKRVADECCEYQIEDKEHANKVLDAIDKSEDIPDSHIDEHKKRLEKGDHPTDVMSDFFKDLHKEKHKASGIKRETMKKYKNYELTYSDYDGYSVWKNDKFENSYTDGFKDDDDWAYKPRTKENDHKVLKWFNKKYVK